MIIYVSGPLSNDDPNIRMHNIEKAINAGIVLLSMGHTPIIPHLTQYVADRIDELKADRFNPESEYPVQTMEDDETKNYLLDLDIFTYENWLLYDFRLIDACDALLYLGPSKGADMEKIYALHIGKKVFLSIKEIKNYKTALAVY